MTFGVLQPSRIFKTRVLHAHLPSHAVHYKHKQLQRIVLVVLIVELLQRVISACRRLVMLAAIHAREELAEMVGQCHRSVITTRKQHPVKHIRHTELITMFESCTGAFD